MPLRDFRCINCGNTVEYLIRSDADIPSRCEACGSEQIEQAITAHGGVQGAFGTVPKKNAGSYKRG